uniref:Uncharacterized protein n=1 Tax=Solanum tuberosum TaxID=4113 RepID=M1DL25_SOLTU
MVVVHSFYVLPFFPPPLMRIDTIGEIMGGGVSGSDGIPEDCGISTTKEDMIVILSMVATEVAARVNSSSGKDGEGNVLKLPVTIEVNIADYKGAIFLLDSYHKFSRGEGKGVGVRLCTFYTINL